MFPWLRQKLRGRKRDHLDFFTAITLWMDKLNREARAQRNGDFQVMYEWKQENRDWKWVTVFWHRLSEETGEIVESGVSYEVEMATGDIYRGLRREDWKPVGNLYGPLGTGRVESPTEH